MGQWFGGLGQFPRSVYFIVGNEFCERFSYYGLRSVLQTYFVCLLDAACDDAGESATARYRDAADRATVIVHVFTFIAYASAVLGGYVADCWAGKFATIAAGMLLYVCGAALLAVSAYGSWYYVSLAALGLIGFGTGAIKSVVSSYVGDQIPAAKAHLMDS